MLKLYKLLSYLFILKNSYKLQLVFGFHQKWGNRNIYQKPLQL